MTDLKFTNEAEFYSAIKAFRLVEVGRQSFGGQSGWTVQYEDEPRSFGRKPEIFGECTSLDDRSEFYGTITVRSCGVHHKGAQNVLENSGEQSLVISPDISGPLKQQRRCSKEMELN